MSEGNGKDQTSELRILQAVDELKSLFAHVHEKMRALHELVVSSTNDQTTLHQSAVDHENRIAKLEAEFALRRVG